jgi:hypothetical protein
MIVANRNHLSFEAARAVTPSDTVDLPDGPCNALHISVAGALKIHDGSGTAVTFANVPVGVFRVIAVRVFATGTAATGIVALY